MADKTGIEWTEATWNPLAGCAVVSPGCTHCYAMKMAARIEAMGTAPHYNGLTKPSKGGAVWTGKIVRAPDNILLQPLHWKRPRTIFVNSMSDLFHDDVRDEWIDQVFAIMALCPQHIFQVLTKRPARMRSYLTKIGADTLIKRVARARLEAIGRGERGVLDRFGRIIARIGIPDYRWPLPNVWLGTSVEDQKRADERIPDLLATPAAVRFISAEPLLGPLQLDEYCDGWKFVDWLRGRWWHDAADDQAGAISEGHAKLDWVIVGGESGSGSRPMHPDWARSLRDQCAAAGVAFFFKQFGEWAPGENANRPSPTSERGAWFDEDGWHYRNVSRRESEAMHRDDAPDLWRLGKKSAGRLLDGVEHNAMPGQPR